MVNETLVEVVRFQAAGLTEIQARTKAMGTQIAEATTKSETLARLLGDNRWTKFAQRVEGARKQYELLSLSARNAAAAQGLADGTAARHLRSVTALNAEYAQIQRRTEMIAKYGERWGGLMAKYGGFGKVLGGAALAAGGTSIAMAKSGFNGTVEGNRFDLEWKMLGREMAGAFKPVMEFATKAARSLREFMEALGPAGQNLVMLGGIAATGYGLMRLGGLGLGGMGLLGLGRGAAARTAAATAAASVAPSVGANLASQAGGAAAGGAAARRGFGAGTLAKGGFVTGVAALLYEAATARPERPNETPGEYYNRIRREDDRSVAGAAFSTAGRAVGKFLSFGTVGPKTAAEEAAANARNAVTLAGGGFEETGSAYDRIQAAIETTSRPEDATAALRSSIDALTLAIKNAESMRLVRPSGGGGA